MECENIPHFDHLPSESLFACPSMLKLHPTSPYAGGLMHIMDIENAENDSCGHKYNI